jgi:hypothetical protein
MSMLLAYEHDRNAASPVRCGRWAAIEPTDRGSRSRHVRPSRPRLVRPGPEHSRSSPAEPCYFRQASRAPETGRDEAVSYPLGYAVGMAITRATPAFGAGLAWLLAVTVPVHAADTFARADGINAAVAADGFDHPVFLCAAPGDERLFVVEQPGRIRWIENGKPSAAVFADLTSVVRYGGERGLLGLAFHPAFERNGYLFVNYTDKAGHTQIVRHTVKRDRSAIDPASAKHILQVKQPFANHNGGHIAFGPDGMLYVGMGDGGAGGDPMGNGQNRHALLGKMLRIDVDHGEPYAIPAGNVFKGRAREGAAETWSLGMRNPWRWSFDFVGRRLRRAGSTTAGACARACTASAYRARGPRTWWSP